LLAAITPLLEQLESLSDAIQQYDEEIERIALYRAPGDQTTRAGEGRRYTYRSCIRPHDLRSAPVAKSRQAGNYFDLRPKQNQSGESCPELRITKAGDHYLRRLLVGSAQYMLGRFGADTDLRRWGLKLAENGGKAPKNARSLQLRVSVLSCSTDYESRAQRMNRYATLRKRTPRV
jgi:transposase